MARAVDVRSVRLIAILACCLAMGTLAVYWRVLGLDYVRYDDATYTGHPLVYQGLTAKGVVWAFTGIHASNWHPLTTISHMVDTSLFGHGPAGPHAVNLLLHIASTVLLFLLLNRMTNAVWPSAFVAAVFALHPLHVESVAWIAERKDVLSTFLWMLTLGAYVRYAERPTGARFAPVVVLFALGLLAKPMLVSLPLTLLLLDYWPLGRLADDGWKKKHRPWPGWRLIREKWLLLALTVGSSAITYYVQHKGGATVALHQVPLWIRIENAAISYVMYIWKMVWPTGLTVFYPYPADPPSPLLATGAIIFLVAVTWTALRFAKNHPYLAVGWFWYLITLVPVIGIVQVGEQIRADRYTYVPLIGLFAAIAWGVSGLMQARSRTLEQGPSAGTNALAAVAVAVICVLSLCTWRQIGYWQNRLTLFSHALEVTKDNYLAHDMVGAALGEIGRYREAIPHYKEAIRIKPNDHVAYTNLGSAYTHTGDLDGAAQAYRDAIRINPGSQLAHTNLAAVEVLRGNVGEAIVLYRKAMEINAGARGRPEIYTMHARENDAAIKQAESELRKRPDDLVVRSALGVALAQRGRLHEAVAHLSLVSKSGISPDELRSQLAPPTEDKPETAGTQRTPASGKAPGSQFADTPEGNQTAPEIPKAAVARFCLGVSLDRQGRRAEAIEEYRKAISIKPDFARAHNNLAVSLFFTGQYAEAWREVHLTRKYGEKVHPGFIKALSEKMPDPGP